MVKIAQYNKCGHNKAWTLRLVDKGHRFEYCIGCIVDKLGIKDLRGETNIAPIDKKRGVDEGKDSNDSL